MFKERLTREDGKRALCCLWKCEENGDVKEMDLLLVLI